MDNNRADRAARIHTLLDRAHQAGMFTVQPFWAELWEALESEMLTRLLKLPVDEDVARFRLATSINVLRQMRKALEDSASPESVKALEKELDELEGRKLRPIA